jgi:hypothetical protein
VTHSVKDTAAHFATSQHTVLHWLATGQLAGINVSRDPAAKKKRWRITDQALAEFELTRSSAARATVSPRQRRKQKDPDYVEFY